MYPGSELPANLISFLILCKKIHKIEQGTFFLPILIVWSVKSCVMYKSLIINAFSNQGSFFTWSNLVDELKIDNNCVLVQFFLNMNIGVQLLMKISENLRLFFLWFRIFKDKVEWTDTSNWIQVDIFLNLFYVMVNFYWYLLFKNYFLTLFYTWCHVILKGNLLFPSWVWPSHACHYFGQEIFI